MKIFNTIEMRKLALIIVFMFMYCVYSLAQDELKVKSFLPSITDLTARTEARMDNEGSPCALLKVVIPEKEVAFECGNLASLIVGDVAFHTNEYWVYLVAGQYGAKHIKIKHPSFPTIDVVFRDYGISTLEPQTTYTLIVTRPRPESRFKQNRFYLSAEGRFGMMNSVGASVGGYIYNVNIEAYYQYGIGASDEIFWNDNSSADGSIPYSYKYIPSTFGGKIGYGVRIGRDFCITPQVGAGCVVLKGQPIQIGDIDPKATDGYSAILSIGAKMDYLFSKNVGLTITPEYTLPIIKSDLYNRVSTISKTISGFANGVTIRVGLLIVL